MTQLPLFNSLAHLADVDQNKLQLVETLPGEMLTLYVEDENDIPIGMFLDKEDATVLRDALSKWIEGEN